QACLADSARLTFHHLPDRPDVSFRESALALAGGGVDVMSRPAGGDLDGAGLHVGPGCEVTQGDVDTAVLGCAGAQSARGLKLQLSTFKAQLEGLAVPGNKHGGACADKSLVCC